MAVFTSSVCEQEALNPEEFSIQISLTLPGDFTANGSKRCFDDFCSLLHKLSVHSRKVSFAVPFQIRLTVLCLLSGHCERNMSVKQATFFNFGLVLVVGGGAACMPCSLIMACIYRATSVSWMFS